MAKGGGIFWTKSIGCEEAGYSESGREKPKRCVRTMQAGEEG